MFLIIFILFLLLVIVAILGVDHSFPFGLLLLPSFYLIFELLAANFKIWKKLPSGMPVLLLRLIFFIKYYLTPIYIIITENTDVPGIEPMRNTISMAIALILYELISIYLFLILSRNKWKCKSVTPIVGKISLNYYILLAMISAIVVFYNPFVFSVNLDILFNSDTSEIISAEGGTQSAVMHVLTVFFKTLLFVISSIYLYIQYSRHPKKIYIYLSIIILCLYLYMFISTSRWNLLFSILGGCAFLYKMYGNKIRQYLTIIAGLGGFLLLGITIYKFRWALVYGNNFEDTVSAIFSFLQPYFSGPYVTAQGVQMANFVSEDLTISTFFNDFLCSFPFVNKLIDPTNITNRYFNQFVTGDASNLSQLIPAISSGYVYFGFAFSNVVILLSIFSLLVFTNFENKCKDPVKRYFYMIGAFWLSLTICVNTQVVYGNLLHMAIIPLIILKVSRLKIF